MSYFTTKNFSNFKGLNLRDSDLIRTSEYASDMKNAMYRSTGAISKRYGYKAIEEVAKHFGMTTYTRLDNNNCNVTELITLSENGILVLQEDTLEITYTNPAGDVLTSSVSMKYDEDTNQYRLILKDDFTVVLDQGLGLGRDELSIYTVQDLINDINTLANFSAALTDGNADILASPAAFIQEIQIDAAANTTTYELSCRTWKEVAAVEGNTPFQTYCNNIDDPEQELPSFTVLKDTLYIAVCDVPLYKYDGTNLVRAGVPLAEDAPINENILAGGNITDPNFWIGYTYVYTDANGNEFESDISPLLGDIALTSENVTVDIPNIAAGAGYDAANMLIRVYTTDDSPAPGDGGPGTLYFQTEVANNPAGGLQTVLIDTEPLDVVGSFEYVEKDDGAIEVPNARYLTVHRNQLIAVDCDECNTVYYSDNLNPERFTASRNFIVENDLGSPISGIKSLENALYVFTTQSIHVVTGTLFDFRFRVDLVTQGQIGCVSHSTIQDVEGTLFFLDRSGVYTITTASGEPVEVSEIIAPYFENTPFDLNFNFRKACATNWVEEDKYILYMPELETDQFSTTFQLFANSNSTCFVFDYYRKAWLIWDNINALNGMTVYDNRLYFTEQNTRNNELSVRRGVTSTYIFKNTGDTTDYSDLTDPVDFQYSTNWDAAGEPSVLKKYLRLKVHALDTAINDFESPGYGLRCEININYHPSAFFSKFELDFGKNQLGYGRDPYGNFSYGNSRFLHRVCKLKQNKCRSIRAIFKNTEMYRNILISGYEYETDTPYKVAIKE